MGEDNINNNSGCDQFTRPEEILELQKYLRAIKEELAERTSLESDVVQMDPSYRVGKIDLDRNLSSTGRIATNMNPESERIDFSNAILGIPLEGFPEEVKLGGETEKLNQEGHKNIDKLPDTKDTINVERIERLEKVREKLVGADTNSPRELETYVEKLDVTPEKIDLGNELIKITGETKEINLSQERVNLVNPKIIESLETKKEDLKGEIPEITLGEGRDKIPFLETKINELPNYKESIESNQGLSQKEIELSNVQSSLPKDQGEMFDPSQEELPDAVLGIPGEIEEINLKNIRVNIPNEIENAEISLSDFLDKMDGIHNEPSQLSKEIEKEGHIPLGQKNIDSLEDTILKEGKIVGENNSPNSLESFLTNQGIIPGNLDEIKNLANKIAEGGYIEGEQKNPTPLRKLPKDSYIEGDLKDPILSEKLPEDGYIEGELKSPNLSNKLSEDGYIEGELKDPIPLKNLSEEGYIKGDQKEPIPLKDLSKDSYIEGEQKNPTPLKNLPEESYIKGELKDPDIPEKLPEDGYIEGELKSPSLPEELSKGGYIEGEQKNPNLHTELPKDGYISGELENINELRDKLPKDGKTKGEFEDIDELRTKLTKDGKTKGEFEKISRLATKLPKKDGKVRGEFEKIDDLAHRLPKKDGYTRGDFKKIKSLTNELPDPEGYPDGSFKEVEKLNKKLPEDGYVDGDFIDFKELNKELPDDGHIGGDFIDIKGLTEELPEDGYMEGDQIQIKSLPKNLPKDSLIDDNDLIEINKLSKRLTEDGKINEGKFHSIENLDEKLSSDGKIEGEFKSIEELNENIPEDGLIDGDFHRIAYLPDELPKDGYTAEGEGKEVKKLTKELPSSSYIDGEFKEPKPIKKLPKDSLIGENNLVEIKKLTKNLPEDGKIDKSDLIELEELTKKLPEDGLTEGDFTEINKLSKKLPDDGHIGEENIVEINSLTKNLPRDGHIGEESIVNIEDLNRIIPEGGSIPGEIEDIYALDASLPFDGHTTGDFKDIDKLTKNLPEPDGYMQGDLIDITELDKALSSDGLIHGESEGPFSEDKETSDLYQYYSSNKEKFSVDDGIIPGSTLPKNDDWEHTTPESKFYQYTGKNGGIHVDPRTREVKYDGTFQIPEGTIAKDTFSSSDLDGKTSLKNRHPLKLDNKEFNEIGGLIPDSTIPTGDTWEHRDSDKLDNRSFDELNGVIPDSTIPRGDKGIHVDPETLYWKYSGKFGGISFDPLTRQVDNTEDKFQIPDGELAEDTFSPSDIEGPKNLENRHPLKLDNKKFNEIGGLIPKSTRPKGEAKYELHEWLHSLSKVDSGAEDLYNALLKRVTHDLDGYYNYLSHYADHKDLSSGWGQKLATLLSSLSGAKIDINTYRNFDYELTGYVMDHYGSSTAKVVPGSVPNGIDAAILTNGYLRCMAEKIKSEHSDLVSKGGFWKTALGIAGLKELSLDKILIELIKLRDKEEEKTGTVKHKLPGDGEIIASLAFDGDVWNAASALGKTFVNRFRSNMVGQEFGDTTNPINKPGLSETGDKLETTGWYDPRGIGSGKSALSGWGLIKSSIEDSVKSKKEKSNYKFSDNYLQGSGIKLTLYDLAERNLDTSEGEISSVEELMRVVDQSPLITSPSKFVTTSSTNRVAMSLDTNSYWEIVIEPYLGRDNGFCSYLPSIEEINILNFRNHGVKTKYSRWIPVSNFDFTHVRTSTKSINLFGGEFSIPGGIEYTNELRISIIDDMFKSWRRYFEKCAEVGVYNSRVHNAEFYGYEGSFIGTPKVKSSKQWERYPISEEDAEKITVVDKSSFVLAPYKNITFRIRLYIMTPQLSTINKYDLLTTLKEVSVERTGDVDPSSQDLELTFSVVGETDPISLMYPNFNNTSNSELDGSDWDQEAAEAAAKKFDKDEKLSPLPPIEKKTQQSKTKVRGYGRRRNRKTTKKKRGK